MMSAGNREGRLLSVLVYLAPLLGGFFILPIVVFFVCRDNLLLRRHAKLALLFQVGFLAAVLIVAILPSAVQTNAATDLAVLVGYVLWIVLVVINARLAWKAYTGGVT
jgi:uncharacterized membrane protein